MEDGIAEVGTRLGYSPIAGRRIVDSAPRRSSNRVAAWPGEGRAGVSQRNVERILGRLVSDEGFRRHYWADPVAALAELIAAGSELNSCERRALAALEREAVERLAAALDPCIQKSDLNGERN